MIDPRLLGRRGRFGLLIIPLVSLTLAGCATSGDPAAPDFTNAAWPEDDPRVRLETIVTSDRDLGKRTRLGWLSGKKQTALFSRPYDAAWLGDTLIITDAQAGRVIALAPDGTVTRSREGALDNPLFVANCGHGLFVSSPRTGAVYRLDADLKVVEKIADDLEHPTGIGCNGGRTVIAETGRHRLVLTDDQGRIRHLGSRGSDPGQFNFPTAVTLSDHTIWVGDTLNFRIQRIDDRDPERIEIFGELGDSPGEMPRIKDVELDSLGQVWVSDAHLDMVSLYTMDGRYLMSIGGPGERAGQFSFPTGIAAHPDGRVAVVDSFNRRVQIFRLVPPPNEDPQ